MKLTVKKKNIISIILTLTALVALVVTVGLFSTAEEKKKAELLDLGAKYLHSLNYEDAIATFEQILSVDPKNIEAYEGIINAYIGLGDYEKAQEYAEKGYIETGSEVVREIVNEYIASDEYKAIVAQNNSKSLNQIAEDKEKLEEKAEQILEESSETDEEPEEEETEEVEEEEAEKETESAASTEKKNTASKPAEPVTDPEETKEETKEVAEAREPEPAKTDNTPSYTPPASSGSAEQGSNSESTPTQPQTQTLDFRYVTDPDGSVWMEAYIVETGEVKSRYLETPAPTPTPAPETPSDPEPESGTGDSSSDPEPESSEPEGRSFDVVVPKEVTLE